MSLYITSANAFNFMQRCLAKSTADYQKNMDQLSSGDKITQIGDDPVSLARTSLFDKQISSNSVAQDNTKYGADMLNIAEGNQNTVLSDLESIYDTCLQAANGTYTNENKDIFLAEIRKRLENINNVANNTEFNDIKLLNGSITKMPIQVGNNSSASIDIKNAFLDCRTASIGGGINIDPATTGATWTNADIATYMGKIDTAISQVINSSSQLGAFGNRLDYRSDLLTNIEAQLQSGRSVIADVDVAEATASLVQNQILQQASVSILSQARQIPEMVVSLLGR